MSVVLFVKNGRLVRRLFWVFFRQLLLYLILLLAPLFVLQTPILYFLAVAFSFQVYFSLLLLFPPLRFPIFPFLCALSPSVVVDVEMRHPMYPVFKAYSASFHSRSPGLF